MMLIAKQKIQFFAQLTCILHGFPWNDKTPLKRGFYSWCSHRGSKPRLLQDQKSPAQFDEVVADWRPLWDLNQCAAIMNLVALTGRSEPNVTFATPVHLICWKYMAHNYQVWSLRIYKKYTLHQRDFSQSHQNGMFCTVTHDNKGT